MNTSTPDLVLTTPAEADRIAVVRRAVGAYSRVYGADEALVDDILTAVSEACTNSVIHAYRPQSDGALVRVEVRHDDPCLFVAIRDWGAGMEPEVEGLEQKSLRLGMALMSALADEIQVRSGPAFGTEVSLTFDLDREPRAPRTDRPDAAHLAGLTTIDAEGPGGLAALKSAIAMLAAQADFSLDRLADLQLLSEILLQRGAPGGATLRVAISERGGGLALEIGPLGERLARELAEEASVNGPDLGSLQRLVERLAGEARTVSRENGDHLEVVVARS